MNTNTLEIGSVLNQLLYKSGMSEVALAKIIDVPRATINRITSGRTPDPRGSTLSAIAAYFNVTVDQLLGKKPLFTQELAKESSFATAIPVIKWHDSNNWKRALKKPKNNFDWISADSDISGGKFALRSEGDAMWPQFQENTLLIIDPSKELKNRDFVIVYIKKMGEILFRQLIIEGKYKFVKAINEMFPTIQLQNSDVIVGSVIQTRNNLG